MPYKVFKNCCDCNYKFQWTYTDDEKYKYICMRCYQKLPSINEDKEEEKYPEKIEYKIIVK